MNDATIEWLLETSNPSVRYFALRDLLDRSEQDRVVLSARRAIMRSAPIKQILAAQSPEGYWFRPGHGYSHTYRATMWQILFLAELGADGKNRLVRRGCEYLLDHALASHGGFSCMAGVPPSGAVHCLNGNLIWALGALGYAEEARVQRAVDWLASAITGEDFDSWYASTVAGPNFACGMNGQKPCAWGAVKSLRALAHLPPALQSSKVKRAIRRAAEFLLSHDPAQADYPFTRRINGEWFKFGFPLSYTSDVLENLLVLIEADYARDPRLQNARALIEAKRDASGTWLLKHSLNGKMWTDIETKGKPSKWLTLRALRVLRATSNV